MLNMHMLVCCTTRELRSEAGCTALNIAEYGVKAYQLPGPRAPLFCAAPAGSRRRRLDFAGARGRADEGPESSSMMRARRNPGFDPGVGTREGGGGGGALHIAPNPHCPRQVPSAKSKSCASAACRVPPTNDTRTQIECISVWHTLY